MQPNHLLKAGILMLIVVVSFFVGWEFYLRSIGYSVSYDDGGPLWADKRARVYQPSDKATVFIGSSRIKYDLDIAAWKRLTGEDAVQLAIEGNSPVPVLDDLANDKNFKGKLVIDVTEGLFFSSAPNNTEVPKENIAYYKKRTPTQRAGFELNHLLESQFVFLDKDYFSLNAILNKSGIKDRPGIYGGPDFPWEFSKKNFGRQSYMDPRFLADTNLQNKVKGIWVAFSKIDREKPAAGRKLDSILQAIKISVDKIKARGGQVVFIRTPSSGAFLAGEKMGFPRTQYWDRLLTTTNTQGIHFEDYPAIAHFQCPELSHLSPADAIIFTENFARLLQGKGWMFPNKNIR